MAKRLLAADLAEIERAVRDQPGGVTAPQVAAALGVELSFRTLQYRLKRLVDDGRLVRHGSGRWSTYFTPEPRPFVSLPGTGEAVMRVSPASPASASWSVLPASAIILSRASANITAQVSRPEAERAPVGYNRAFLDSYRPGVSFYLSVDERDRLAAIGRRHADVPQPAGTYARQILNRLLIDLSWNSSRLEGNTYSLLDTQRLLEFGEEAEGRDRLDAQMILNHKDAIEFLVTNAADIGFNRYTVLNLHGMLANNLLADPGAAGRLRHIGVGISGAVYHPPETPAFIEECFDQVLATAAAIPDPFEQALFVMVQLPYLQPFDDMNKRVSRLAANIPFVRANLSPLVFTDVPRDLYAHAILGVYELNRVELLKDVFVWAYERSAARYAAVRQSLGEPDPFRLRHREGLRALVGEIVRTPMDRPTAARHIVAWTEQHVGADEREQFRTVAEAELLGLHEGNFARYQVRPSEFTLWREAWSRPPFEREPPAR